MGHQVGGRHARPGCVQQCRGGGRGPGAAPPAHQVAASEHGHGPEQVQGARRHRVSAAVQAEAGHQHRARAEADPVGAWQRQEGAGGLAGGAGKAAGGHEEEGGRQEAAAGGDAGRREEEQDVLRRRPGHREMMVRGAGHVPRAENKLCSTAHHSDPLKLWAYF